MSNSGTVSSGTSIVGLLGLAFIIMKLAGIGAVATWSWLWVLAPFWIPLAILAVILVLWGLFAVIAAVVSR